MSESRVLHTHIYKYIERDREIDREKEIDFLRSSFNGISTFIGYSMPKLFSQKNSSGTI